jgi:hypothetical protein
MHFSKIETAPEILERLQALHAGGVSSEEMIGELARASMPKPLVTVALRQAGIMTLRQAQDAVHHSQAYAYRKADDEAFQDSVLNTFDDLAKQDRSAA